MEIDNLSTNNFKGTFILQPKISQTRELIPNVIKKGRQIFYDLKTEGDVVIVTKDKYDKRVCDFIERECVPFEYYPEISTKSGLDDEQPSKLKKLININNNCIVRNIKVLNKFLSGKQIHLSKQSDYIKEAINTMRLNIGDSKVQINDKGMFFIRDEGKKRTIKSSGFKSGMAYFCVIPDSINQSIQRFLVGSNGKSIIQEYNHPENWKQFNKAFNKAIE